jgi:hypothetical protein
MLFGVGDCFLEIRKRLLRADILCATQNGEVEAGEGGPPAGVRSKTNKPSLLNNQAKSVFILKTIERILTYPIASIPRRLDLTGLHH